MVNFRYMDIAGYLLGGAGGSLISHQPLTGITVALAGLFILLSEVKES